MEALLVEKLIENKLYEDLFKLVEKIRILKNIENERDNFVYPDSETSFHEINKRHFEKIITKYKRKDDYIFDDEKWSNSEDLPSTKEIMKFYTKSHIKLKKGFNIKYIKTFYSFFKKIMENEEFLNFLKKETTEEEYLNKFKDQILEKLLEQKKSISFSIIKLLEIEVGSEIFLKYLPYIGNINTVKYLKKYSTNIINDLNSEFRHRLDLIRYCEYSKYMNSILKKIDTLKIPRMLFTLKDISDFQSFYNKHREWKNHKKEDEEYDDYLEKGLSVDILKSEEIDLGRHENNYIIMYKNKMKFFKHMDIKWLSLLTLIFRKYKIPRRLFWKKIVNLYVVKEGIIKHIFSK